MTSKPAEVQKKELDVDNSSVQLMGISKVPGYVGAENILVKAGSTAYKFTLGDRESKKSFADAFTKYTELGAGEDTKKFREMRTGYYDKNIERIVNELSFALPKDKRDAFIDKLVEAELDFVYAQTARVQEAVETKSLKEVVPLPTVARTEGFKLYVGDTKRYSQSDYYYSVLPIDSASIKPVLEALKAGAEDQAAAMLKQLATSQNRDRKPVSEETAQKMLEDFKKQYIIKPMVGAMGWHVGDDVRNFQILYNLEFSKELEKEPLQVDGVYRQQTSEAIKNVQRKLLQDGYYDVLVARWFGVKNWDSLEESQQDKYRQRAEKTEVKPGRGLVVDGLLGRLTRGAMEEYFRDAYGKEAAAQEAGGRKAAEPSKPPAPVSAPRKEETEKPAARAEKAAPARISLEEYEALFEGGKMKEVPSVPVPKKEGTAPVREVPKKEEGRKEEAKKETVPEPELVAITKGEAAREITQKEWRELGLWADVAAGRKTFAPSRKGAGAAEGLEIAEDRLLAQKAAIDARKAAKEEAAKKEAAKKEAAKKETVVSPAEEKAVTAPAKAVPLTTEQREAKLKERVRAAEEKQKAEKAKAEAADKAWEEAAKKVAMAEPRGTIKKEVPKPVLKKGVYQFLEGAETNKIEVPIVLSMAGNDELTKELGKIIVAVGEEWLKNRGPGRGANEIAEMVIGNLKRASEAEKKSLLPELRKMLAASALPKLEQKFTESARREQGVKSVEVDFKVAKDAEQTKPSLSFTYTIDYGAKKIDLTAAYWWNWMHTVTTEEAGKFSIKNPDQLTSSIQTSLITAVRVSKLPEADKPKIIEAIKQYVTKSYLEPTFNAIVKRVSPIGL